MPQAPGRRLAKFFSKASGAAVQPNNRLPLHNFLKENDEADMLLVSACVLVRDPRYEYHVKELVGCGERKAPQQAPSRPPGNRQDWRRFWRGKKSSSTIVDKGFSPVIAALEKDNLKTDQATQPD
jgi:hypothetical protein